MCRKLLFLAFGFIFFSNAQAQNFTVSGRLQDPESRVALQGATVVLQSIKDSLNRSTTYTDTAGHFQFDQLYADSFRLLISSVGYETLTRSVKVDSADVVLGIIGVPRTSKQLTGVTVTASIPPATQKGDTVQINASQYKVNPDATAEELVRKMPGITVENGQVKAQGENVQKVTIDGRELFGDDATAALRNLPAEIIDKIQVFDRLSDQAAFTGFDDGNSQKGINIVTKANMRNGQFGRIYAGYGTDNRYQAGGNTTFLKENRKISIVGNFNNTNQQNFAQQDLLGVTSSGGRGGRGGGGRGGNFGGGGNNFSVGTQPGINLTNAFGINYADQWGTKATVSASYFFNNTDNTTDELLTRQYLSKEASNLQQSSFTNSKNTNHRFNMRLEYRFDSANQLIITPNVSLQQNEAYRNSASAFLNQATGFRTSNTQNISNSNRNGTNLNNNILFRHSFPKRGRTFSVNLNTSYNQRVGDVYTDYFDTAFLSATVYEDSLSQRFTDQSNNGLNLSTNLVYTEPIGAKSQLQFNYNPSWSRNEADQQAYEWEEGTKAYSLFNQRLSSRFENNTRSHNAGLSYRYGDRDNQISFGANYQNTNLYSDQEFPRRLTVDKSFQNILPNAMVRLKLSDRSNIRLFYRSNTNQPSVTQLQDVVDETNAPFITLGNPQLEQQFTNMLSGRYTYTNTTSGILLVGNVFFQTAKNYITNATYLANNSDVVINPNFTLKRGQQLSTPVNLDGYMNLRSFVNFSIPLKFIKSNFNLNTGVSYSQLPGMINFELNETQNTTYTLGSVIASNVSQYVDFTVSYAANFSDVTNKLNARQNSKYFSHVAGLQFNLLTKNGWFLQNDLNNQLYSGLSEGFNQNYFLWNLGVGKKFLKDNKGELRLNVFDLLKQNQSIIRTVQAEFIEDVQNVVLQQYFMLTFTYNLRTFGAAPTRGGGGNFNRNPGGGGPPRF
jgi:hypothetical protein